MGSPDDHRTLLRLERILDGLNYLHDLKVAHGDLKPENVLLRADGSLVLGDLGNLVAVEDSRENKHLRNTTKIHSGRCAAPEINNREGKGPTGFASDIWEVGIMLGIMLPPPSAMY